MGGIGLIALAALALMLAAGVIYQQAARQRDARKFPPPGRMADVGGVRLHTRVSGPPTAPPVVLEAGIAATSLSWDLVEKRISGFATVVSYDRAGLGWSEPSRKPRGIPQLVSELRALLSKLNIASPRVIAAHSFGGLIALDYAARFPDEVAGIVLVDPPGIVEWANPSAAHRTMLSRGIFLSRLGEILARIGVVRFTLNRLASGARGMPKLVARATSGGQGQAFMERMAGEIQKLPRELWPFIQSHWCDQKCFRSMGAYLRALPEGAAWVLREAGSIRAPLIVLSAANASASQRADHDRIACLSPRGRVEVVESSTHWIQLDRPDLVAQAIGELCR